VPSNGAYEAPGKSFSCARRFAPAAGVAGWSPAKSRGSVMTVLQADWAAVAEVIAAENERCDATRASDGVRLDRVYADELTNQHSNGHTNESNAQIIERCTSARHTTYTRGDLDIRVYGETAVANGELVLPSRQRLTAHSACRRSSTRCRSGCGATVAGSSPRNRRSTSTIPRLDPMVQGCRLQ
jgi:hypothetical protein